MDVTEIQRRIDQTVAGPVPIASTSSGGLGLVPRTWGEAMEAAKLMAVSGAAVPKWLRNNPGGCFAVTMRALRWGMDPFAVAEKTYVVFNKGEERIAYEAQLVHAVITALAPLKSRLRYEIIGEDGERRCKVWGTFRGENEPHVYESETLARQLATRPKRKDGEGFGGSPLWDTNPEVQMAYSAVRQWCRLHASEVLLGVYTPDEVEDSQPVEAPVSKIEMYAQQLREAKAASAKPRGLDVDHVKNAANTIIEGDHEEVEDDDSRRVRDEPDDAGRRAVPDSERDNQDQGRGDAAGGEDSRVGSATARSQAAKVEGQGEIFDAPETATHPKGKGKR